MIQFDLDPWQELRSRIDRNAPLSRLCYAAAHVVMQESYGHVNHSVESPGSPGEIAENVDWNVTSQIRTKIAESGMGIAEAMDTAQRFSLGWESASRLIKMAGDLDIPFCAGASTDHLELIETKSDLIDGVCEQVEFIRSAGGIPVVLPMPLMTDLRADADRYVEVYSEIARNSSPGPMRLACVTSPRPVMSSAASANSAAQRNADEVVMAAPCSRAAWIIRSASSTL